MEKKFQNFFFSIATEKLYSLIEFSLFRECSLMQLPITGLL